MAPISFPVRSLHRVRLNYSKFYPNELAAPDLMHVKELIERMVASCTPRSCDAAWTRKLWSTKLKLLLKSAKHTHLNSSPDHLLYIRSIAVRLDRIYSNAISLRGGIPQGTRWAPLLFAIPVNNLCREWLNRLKYVDVYRIYSNKRRGAY